MPGKPVVERMGVERMGVEHRPIEHDLAVLAGGSGRRLGGADKADLVVGGTRLLDRVLAAAPGACVRVVVGPVRPTDVAVLWCREDPAGGGPVAALAAAVAHLVSPSVVVLAVDLPLVGQPVLERLLRAVQGHAAAIGVDETGRDQPLLAAYDVSTLRRALDGLGEVTGASMRSLVARLEVGRLDVLRVDVADVALDCDTWDDVARAERTLG